MKGTRWQKKVAKFLERQLPPTNFSKPPTTFLFFTFQPPPSRKRDRKIKEIVSSSLWDACALNEFQLLFTNSLVFARRNLGIVLTYAALCFPSPPTRTNQCCIAVSKGEGKSVIFVSCWSFGGGRKEVFPLRLIHFGARLLLLLLELCTMIRRGSNYGEIAPFAWII